MTGRIQRLHDDWWLVGAGGYIRLITLFPNLAGIAAFEGCQVRLARLPHPTLHLVDRPGD